MKRLIKKADESRLNTIKLMCGTTSSRVIDIINNGGFEAGQSSGWEDTNQGFVFFTNDENNALSYADFTWNHDGRNPWDYLAIVHVDVISNSLAPDNDDCPECETWEESLEQIGQVAIRGKVSTNTFTHIDVFNGNKQKIGSYPYSDNLEMKFQSLAIIDVAKYQVSQIETVFSKGDIQVISTIIDRANQGIDEVSREFELKFPRFEYNIENNVLTMNFQDVNISTDNENSFSNFEKIKAKIDEYNNYF